MVIISNSDGGDDDGTSDGGDGDGTSDDGDTCGSDDGDDGIARVVRSARSLSCRMSRSTNRRLSVGRPHSELVGAARHTTGRSRLRLPVALAPFPPQSSLQGRKPHPRGLRFSCPWYISP
jgi:hypothetical protein